MAAAVQLEQFDVFALIEEELAACEGEVDLHDIADRVVARVPKRDLPAALAQLIPAAASLQARRSRRDHFRRPTLTVVNDAGAPASRRWERASDAVAQRAEQIRSALVTVGPNRRKPLADCSADEVQALVDMHQRLSDENLSRADSYSRLLATMREKRVKKAGKLKDAVLVAALDGEPA